MARDSDVIVVNDKLHIKLLGDRNSCCFCVVAFLLRAVGAEAKHGLATISESHTIDQGPMAYVMRKRVLSET